MGTLILALCIGQDSVQVAPAVTPAQAVEAAAADLASQPAELRKHLRYLWIGTLPEKEWADAWRTLSFHCNSLSVESEIVMPRVLPCKTVAAITLLDYGPNWKTVWEKLADSEPYFHAKLFKVVEKKVRSESGKSVTKKEEKAEVVFGPWLTDNPETAGALKALVEGTKSQVPLVRGDWFVWKSAIQADRGEVGYYRWLGITDQKSFEELIGFDEKFLKRFPKEIREVVVSSSVTLMSRRLDRRGKFGEGPYWLSSDVKLAQGERNGLRFLNGGFKADAHEGIGAGANGLHFYFLGNADGAAQDSAPDSIASDGFAHSNDRRVHVGFSCVRCHYTENGIRSVDGWARGLFQKPLSLQSPDYATAKKLQRLYFSQIEPVIDDDRRLLVRAVATATGWEPKEAAKQYERVFVGYDSPLSVETMASELGVTKERLIEVVKDQASKTPEMDLVIGSVLSDKPKTIPRVIWEESFPVAMVMVRAK